MISFPCKESQRPQDTGHSASSVSPHLLLGPREGEALHVRPSFPSTESSSLLGLQRELHLPLLHAPGWRGPGGRSLHRAVLSVSLSMSNRMRPGTSLLAESECVSGKVLRSDSETLELVS